MANEDRQSASGGLPITSKEEWVRKALDVGGLLKEKAWNFSLLDEAKKTGPAYAPGRLLLVRIEVKAELRRDLWQPVVFLVEKKSRIDAKVGRLHTDGWWQAGKEWSKGETPGGKGPFKWGIYDPKSDQPAMKKWAERLKAEMKWLVEGTDKLKEQVEMMCYERGVVGQLLECLREGWLKEEQARAMMWKWLVEHRADNPAASALNWYGRLQKDLQSQLLSPWQQLGVASEGAKAWLGSMIGEPDEEA